MIKLLRTLKIKRIVKKYAKKIYLEVNISDNIANDINLIYEKLLLSGNIDESCEVMELALKRKFDESKLYNLLFSLIISSPKKYSHDRYLKTMLKYGKKIYPFNYKRFNSSKDDLVTDKKLKVGYICHFFSNNISQKFLWPLIKGHSDNKFDIVVLSDDRKANVIPNDKKKWIEFKESVNFVDTSHFDEEGFCDYIKKEKFDILLELNGHCHVSRYRELNRRIAPIQISFYNIAGPCAVRNIDYIFYHPSSDIAPIRNFYTEKFFPLEKIFSTKSFEYYPNEYSPPSLKNGFVTFGSFGAIHKLHIDHLDLYCKILKNVPNSKLFIKCEAMNYEDIKDIWIRQFSQRGIEKERLRLEGYEPHNEMLKKYQYVDIALDTFPHNSGTTTLDCLYMGIPVIALNGERLCSQIAKKLIGIIGFKDDMLAYNEDEYVDKAVSLSKNPEKLLYYKENLRKRYLDSDLVDEEGIALALEKAYREMWAKYIEEGKGN